MDYRLEGGPPHVGHPHYGGGRGTIASPYRGCYGPHFVEDLRIIEARLDYPTAVSLRAPSEPELFKEKKTSLKSSNKLKNFKKEKKIKHT